MPEPSTFTVKIPISLTVAGQTRAFEIEVPASQLLSTSQSEPGPNPIEERYFDIVSIDRIRLKEGHVDFAEYKNEQNIKSTSDDPGGYGVECKSGGGKWAGRTSVDGGKAQEIVLWQFKGDERYRGQAGVFVGEATMHLRKPHVPGTTGDDMVLVATYRHDGIQFHVPVHGFVSGPDTLPGPKPVPVPVPVDTNAAKLEHLRDLERRYTPIKFDETDIAGYLNGDSDRAYMEALMLKKNDGNAR